MTGAVVEAAALSSISPDLYNMTTANPTESTKIRTADNTATAILPILFSFPYSKYIYYLNLENHMRHFLNFLFFWKWSLFLCKTKEIIC